MKKPSFFKNQIEITTLFKDRNASLPTKGALVLIGLSWLGLPFFWRKLPPQVPILYSRPWGEQQLLNKPFILLLPGLAALLTLINLGLVSFLFSNQKALAYFLVWFNLVIIFLEVITFWRILFIIT